MTRIKTANGFFREVLPTAGPVDYAFMSLLAFAGGAAGLCVATIYCLPFPLAVLALVGLGQATVPVFSALALIGGGAALGVVTAWRLEEIREEHRRREEQLRRGQDPGPWHRCVLRTDSLHQSLQRVNELPVVPRRWR